MDIGAEVIGHTRIHGDDLLTDGLAHSVLSRQMEKRSDGHAKFLQDHLHYSKDGTMRHRNRSRDLYYEQVRRVYTFASKPNVIMLATDDPDGGRVYQSFKVSNTNDVSRIKRHINDARRRRYPELNDYYLTDQPGYHRVTTHYRTSSRSPSPVYLESTTRLRERVQTVPVVERVEKVPVVERIETVPVMERIERPKVVERVETIPVMERVEKVPVVERIERPSVVERIQTVPVMERVETVPVVERIERPSMVERVQPVPIVERVETIPVVERVETVPIVERIERPSVVERVQRVPTIMRERTPSPVYVTSMPRPPSTYSRQTEIYVPEPEPEPVVYKSVAREVPIKQTYLERVETVPVVERIERQPVIERTVIQERTPSPVYVQTVQKVQRPATTTTYIRPSEVMVTESAVEPVLVKRTSCSIYASPTDGTSYYEQSLSPRIRRRSSTRRHISESYEYDDPDASSLILRRVSKVTPT